MPEGDGIVAVVLEVVAEAQQTSLAHLRHWLPPRPCRQLCFRHTREIAHPAPAILNHAT